MFCSKCGKEINDNVKFCPNCGNTIGGSITSNTINNPNISTNEIFIKGYRCAEDTPYYAFTYFLPLAILLLGIWIWQYSGFGLVLALVGFILAFIIRKIFKRSIKYDSSTKSFIKNPSCKLKFAIKSISLDKIQKVRIRYVKKGYLDGQYSLNDMGNFYVISFDSANKEESLSVWSIKKGNLDDFIPIIENAFNENSLSIQIDRNDTLMSGKDFKDGK